MQKLVTEYYSMSMEEDNPVKNELKYYLLKITQTMLRMFRHTKFSAEIKKQILNSTFNFVSNEFMTILSTSYRL